MLMLPRSCVKSAAIAPGARDFTAGRVVAECSKTVTGS